ncbi:MAG: AbrB/MazE/SpoVT family DNA-binding domain-containing protein [Ignavibacteriae bacterium]|jgi:AbrB family looped-hinge helix DNA binding protein|nr:MAG: AbrB/MazE/SpoVT family DNA-binding domain-containing protein [Ignavibacteriota bacterium]
MSTTVTVSPKFQIVIPQEIRERMDIKPGQKVTFVEWQGAIAIVPVIEAEQAFGFLKGKNLASASDGESREKDHV